MKVFQRIKRTNWFKTIVFNFHYFPFTQAIKLPVLVDYQTSFVNLKGEIVFDCPLKRGILRLGYLGTGTQDTKYERTKWDVTGTIVLHGEARIGRGTNICVGGELILGRGFTITGASTIICQHKIQFYDDVLISWDCLLMDTDFHRVLNEEGDVINKDNLVMIGSHVWIGCRSIVLKGAAIPNNCVIAAGSTITRQLHFENCIYGGKDGGNLLKKSITWMK